jgi:hypothetical protein
MSLCQSAIHTYSISLSVAKKTCVARKLVAAPNTSRAAAAQNPISLPVIPVAARHPKIDAAAANRRPQPRALAGRLQPPSQPHAQAGRPPTPST